MKMPFRSIKSLYPLALAEGEGVGTAYEYFAKRLVLTRWLSKLERVSRLLIAGLPEKYGTSLDFFLIAQELNAGEIVVVDERRTHLEKIRGSIVAAQAKGELTRIQPRYVLVADMAQLSELTDGFDLCLGSEVLQRLDSARQKQYVERLAKLSPALALFAPNADDPAHTNLSGLAGLTLTQLRTLAEPLGTLAGAGYVDMPPFPPGLTRSAAQRDKASSGLFEAFAMWGLQQYARNEKRLPSKWRRDHAHIVYALVDRPKPRS